jgi:gamma-glutamyltranspeptidase/glutathione hydrolase
MLQRHHGNAVDAAVATAFALSVTRPASCGIGGGGFMVIHFDRDPRFGTRSIALNYREPAPAAVNGPDYFQRLERDRGLTEAATRGATAVGVPSSVAGLLYALEHYGTLDRKTVLAPAIRLAHEGFVVDAEYMRTATQQIEPYRDDPARQRRFAFVWERFLGNGQVKVGDRIAVPEQAEALRLIAERGAEAFYSGPIAEAILEAVRADGGAAHLTAEDLRTARYVESVEPLRFNARGRTFITMPPPSSGGVALAEAYGILDRVAVYPPPLKRGAEHVHLQVEAMKHAFADRATYLADPNFADVPVKRLMSDDYLKDLASRVNPYRTLATDRYGSAAGKGRSAQRRGHLPSVRRRCPRQCRRLHGDALHRLRLAPRGCKVRLRVEQHAGRVHPRRRRGERHEAPAGRRESARSRQACVGQHDADDRAGR